jgi:hypothetical protein
VHLPPADEQPLQALHDRALHLQLHALPAPGGIVTGDPDPADEPDAPIDDDELAPVVADTAGLTPGRPR